MKKSLTFICIFLAIVLFIASQCIFFVGQTKRGFVLQLGEPVGHVREPGLNFKLPFIQNAVLVDSRILTFEIPKTTSLSSDMKPFEIDNYACWRITNPLIFIKTLNNEERATEVLKSIVFSQLRVAIGSQTLKEVVNTNRTAIMDSVLTASNEKVSGYGVEIIDVRIKRSDLPNRDAIFGRMRANREKMANQYRAEGQSAKLDIISQANRMRDIILAEAQKTSTILRGEADAQAMGIMREALSTSPEFFEFSKSLEVYRNSFNGTSKFILSTDDEILKYFQ